VGRHTYVLYHRQKCSSPCKLGCCSACYCCCTLVILVVAMLGRLASQHNSIEACSSGRYHAQVPLLHSGVAQWCAQWSVGYVDASYGMDVRLYAVAGSAEVCTSHGERDMRFMCSSNLRRQADCRNVRVCFV
jgi:hypothetical protein